MHIALDYDETYTVDPDLWLPFVKHAKARGHTVYVVTMRYPQETASMDPRLVAEVERIIATGRQLKRRFCESMGIYIDVWVDDTPEYIVTSDLVVY